MREGGGNCLKYLERGKDRKEWREHKDFKEVGALKRGAGTLLRIMISYKKDHFLLGLTLNFQISFVLHLDEVKLWAIITYKHGIYELTHELPNDLRFRILGN